ncbi:MAG: hypothetical protein ACYS8X_13955 [Planctomycetota bacterium]
MSSNQAKSSSRLQLNELLEDFAEAFVAVDSLGESYRHYQAGIGPFTESKALEKTVEWLKRHKAPTYARTGPKPYPESRRKCDLVIPSQWALEVKLARPFGDNDQEDEHWFENLLYPYPKKFNNDSSVSDYYKLFESGFSERKGILVFGYEHSEPRIPLERAIRAFELTAKGIAGFALSDREETRRPGLIHPVHQTLVLYAWEILSHVQE